MGREEWREKLLSAFREATGLTEDDLERLYEAKAVIEKLMDRVTDEEVWKLLDEASFRLGRALVPVCPRCMVRCEPFITSLADLYDPAMAQDAPNATTPFWTGEWYCPKCGRWVAAGECWWRP